MGPFERLEEIETMAHNNDRTRDASEPGDGRSEGNGRSGGDGRSDSTGKRRSPVRPSRRRFLQTAAATTAVAGLGGVGAAQLEESEIELDGVSDGWVGVSPEEIADETNPTLELEAGETYDLTWENIDGIGHNFVIIDDDGDQLVETEIIEGEGETQTVEFEAEDEMAEYYCEPHPQTMRGDITTDGEEEEDPDEEAEPYFPEGPTVGVEPVAEGLVAPTDFHDPDGTDYQYVSDQMGEVYRIGEDGLEDDPFLDIGDRMVDVGQEFAGGYADEDGDYDERGLLGLEFHPEDDSRVFVSYSAPPDDETPDGWSHVQVLAEFEADEDGESADPDSERSILEIQHPQFNHDSGPMAFGPDGYLYVPMGDGGGGNDSDYGHVEDWYDENEGGNGQDTEENLLGGVLRIDVDEEEDQEFGEYGIPEDNPFAEGGDLEGEGLEEYYAWGLRNPFGITFSDDDRCIVADAGQVLYEAAYQIEPGENYGWNVREGSHCFSTETPATPPEECPMETPEDVRGGEPLVDPVVEYPQVYEGQGVGIVIIGGHTYETDTVEELEGQYIFGDWTVDQGRQQPQGRVFAATPEDIDTDPDSVERDEYGGRPQDDLWEMEEVVFDGGEDGELHHFVRQFGRGADGEVYILANQIGIPEGDTGVVLEIVPEGEGVELEAPEEAEEEPDDDEDVEDEDEHPGDVDEEDEEEADEDQADDEATDDENNESANDD